MVARVVCQQKAEAGLFQMVFINPLYTISICRVLADILAADTIRVLRLHGILK